MKITSAAAGVLILIIFLTSCGLITINDGDNNPVNAEESETSAQANGMETVPFETYITSPETPSKPVEEIDYKAVAQKYVDNLISRDLEKLPIIITATDMPTFVPQDTSNLVYNTRIERNQMVEKKYNIKILAMEYDADSIFQYTKYSVSSGEYYTDIIAVPSTSLGRFYAEGLLMNLNSLPFTDYTAEYFDTEAMNQMIAGHGLYGAVGELNKNIDYYYVIYFNKTLLSSLNLENPYDLVYDGEWTLDKFREMALAAADIDGKYGHGSSASFENYIDMFYLTTGNHYFSIELDKTAVPIYSNTETENFIAKMKNLLSNDNTIFEGKYAPEKARDAFYNGDLLFYADRLFVTNWFVDMEDDWGILPYPKLDKSQREYYTYTDETLPVVAVPSNSSNIENIGLYLQAANAASYGHTNEVYYTLLQRDVIRDNDSLNMLDYITGANGKGKLTMDFAHMFGQAYSYIAEGTYKALRSAVNNNYSIATLFKNHYNTLISRNAVNFPNSPK